MANMMSQKVRSSAVSSGLTANAKTRQVGKSSNVVKVRLERYESMMADIANGNYGVIEYNNGTELRARWTTTGLVVFDEHSDFNMLIPFDKISPVMQEIETEYDAFLALLQSNLSMGKKILFEYDLTYFRQGVQSLIMWKLVRNVKPSIEQLRFLKTCPNAVDLASQEVRTMIRQRYENCPQGHIVSFTSEQIKGKTYRYVRETISVCLLPVYMHKGGEQTIYRRKLASGRLQPLGLTRELPDVTQNDTDVDEQLPQPQRKPKQRNRNNKKQTETPNLASVVEVNISESPSMSETSMVTMPAQSHVTSIDALFERARNEQALREREQKVERERQAFKREEEARLIEQFSAQISQKEQVVSPIENRPKSQVSADYSKPISSLPQQLPSQSSSEGMSDDDDDDDY